jgi:SAM-dependent methyltransferase
MRCPRGGATVLARTRAMTARSSSSHLRTALRQMREFRPTKEGRRRAYLAHLAQRLAEDWNALELDPRLALQDVPCTSCPKLALFPARCTMPHGSRLRACISASTELHLRGAADQLVLEVGCGESSFARAVVEAAGGRWVGLDARPGKGGKRSVRSIAGRVQRLPFASAAFDVVCGTQTIEHWTDPATPDSAAEPGIFLDEIYRVIKPGGWIYFDAPIHLHGSIEFVRGDLALIRRRFARHPWENLRMLSWRRVHAPLAPHFAPQVERARWEEFLPELGADERAAIAERPAWILAIRAEKPRA